MLVGSAPLTPISQLLTADFMHFLFDHIARFIQTWGYWAVLFGLLGMVVPFALISSPLVRGR